MSEFDVERLWQNLRSRIFKLPFFILNVNHYYVIRCFSSMSCQLKVWLPGMLSVSRIMHLMKRERKSETGISKTVHDSTKWLKIRMSFWEERLDMKYGYAEPKPCHSWISLVWNVIKKIIRTQMPLLAPAYKGSFIIVCWTSNCGTVALTHLST
jgi:hypothetical protein